MFYIEKDNEIVLVDKDKEKLICTLEFMPQYQGLEIKETDRLIENFQFTDTEEYKEQKQKEERERLDNLSLTAADVERAIYKAKGMDFDDILELVKDNPEIDLKALKIELKANNFYRGNPYINTVGALLGFMETQLDEFFETGNYEKLLPVEEPEEEITDEETNGAGEASQGSSNPPAIENIEFQKENVNNEN